MITSTANAQIKELEKLKKRAKTRKESKTFIVEGRKMVEEAKEHIVKIYVSETYEKENASSLTAYNTFEVVGDRVFEEVSDTMTPQGILAIVRMPEYSIDTILKKEIVSLILLEDLRDPGNLGTIMRTAEGAGMDGVILSAGSVDLFNPKTVRSTMGSIFRMPFLYVEDFQKMLLFLKENGVSLYAAHLQGKKDYREETYSARSGILIGNEANGLTAQTSQQADFLVKIPMEGALESLNAAVASALMMYEVYNSRRVSVKKIVG